ncbi:MAG TPA: shikimate kinase, partial [Pirellulales bacterium]
QLAALRLGWEWVDADVEIELQAAKSIAAIFADAGEQSFRNLETAMLGEQVQRDRCVVALGGGVVLQEENRRLLQEAAKSGRGRIVWLKASPEALWQRIQADPTTAARRPNLTAAGGVKEVRRLLREREGWYQQCADLSIDTENKSTIEVAEEIVARMK